MRGAGEENPLIWTPKLFEPGPSFFYLKLYHTTPKMGHWR